MRFQVQLGAVLVGVCLLGGPGPRAQACDPVGNVQFLCGVENPEDLVPIPRSTAIVVSGMQAPGKLYRVNTTDRSVTVLFPSATVKARPDTKTYKIGRASCRERV